MSTLRFPRARWTYATFVQALEEAVAFFVEGDLPDTPEADRYHRLIALLHAQERPIQVRRFARILDAMPEAERVSAEALDQARVHALSVRADVSEDQVRELSEALARVGELDDAEPGLRAEDS